MNQKNHPGDPDSAEKKIADFLQTLVTKGGLEIESKILACNGQVQPESGALAGTVSIETASSNPDFKVDLSGPDTPLLLTRNGELLHAIEHVAAKILRLESEDHDRISFDSEGFKAARDRNLQLSAQNAIQRVRATGQPYAFPPMTSRERRMLHLILTQSGHPTASSGEGPRRFVVLYPEDYSHSPSAPAKPQSAPARTQAIRNRFRPR